MNKPIFFLSVVAGSIAICLSACDGKDLVTHPQGIAIANANLAITIALAGDDDETPDVPEDCPCGGTGRSGDGLGPCGVPDCPYREAATEENPMEIPLGRFVLAFIAEDCNSSRTWERLMIRKLADSKWLITDDIADDDAHCLLIDVDLFPDLADRYNVTQTPTFVRVNDRDEIDREDRYIDTFEFADLYRGYPSHAPKNHWRLQDDRGREITNVETLRRHLRDAHSVRMIDSEGLSFGELKRIHGAAHEPRTRVIQRVPT